MKEIEENTNKWRGTSCSWIGRINTVTMLIWLKAIYRFSAIHIKIPIMYFTEVGKNISKIYMEPQTTLNSQRNPEEQKTGDVTSHFLISSYTIKL